MGFYLVCLGFKNLYIAVLLVGWCQFLFMVILFLTFYLLGIKFSELTWRIWILFWFWMIFHVWKIPLLSFLKFEFSLIGMDCNDSSQWISKSSTQRFCTHCCFWCYVHSLIVTHGVWLIQYILMWFLFYRFWECHTHVTGIHCLKAIQLLDYYRV